MNLIAGASGSGVTNTQLQVLTDTQGNSFTVGGAGAQALNATSAGLGIANLTVNSSATQVALGADSATAGQGLTLVADGANLAGASGQAATSTTLTVQTSNYATGGTAQNVGQKTFVVLNDGSANGNNDILNQINAAVSAATGTMGAASYENGSPLSLGTASKISGTTFTLAAGSPQLTASGTGATVVDVPSTAGNAVGQFTQYTIGQGANLQATQNSDGSTTYTVTDAASATGNQVSTQQTFLSSNVADGAATDVSTLTGGTTITLANNVAPPTNGQTLSVASTTTQGDTALYKIGANAVITPTNNNNGTTTYTITDAVAGDSTIQNYKPATTAGSDFTLNSDGSISVTANSKNASMTNLGNGSTEYTVVTARDANGNATSEVNVISANVSGLTVPAGSNLTDALNGASSTNSTAAVATRTAALGAVVGALNGAGFNANIDGSNNLTIAGNNIDTTANANGINLTSAVTNLTGAAGTNIGGVTTATTQTTTGTATLALGNDAVGTGEKLFVTGAILAASSGGAAAANTNITLTTDKAETVVMLSDGSTGGASSQSDVLNQLNALSSGIADYTGGSGTVSGSVFTVKDGAIVLANGQTGGSITTLNDGSTEYSYQTNATGGNNAVQTVNVIVAGISAQAAANSGVALDGTQSTDTAANEALRASTLGTLVNAVNAGGFNASLNTSTGALVVSGQNLTNAAVGTGTFTVSTTSQMSTATIALGTDTVAAGTQETLQAGGSVLGSSSGGMPNNSSITLQTANYGTATSETPTSPGATTVLMLSDNTGFGTPSAESASQTNSLNEVLNQLNTLSAGIADSSNGSGGITTGTAFTVDSNTGQIVAVANGGGTVKTLSDGSTEYSYAAKDPTSGLTIPNQTLNLIVANISGLASSSSALGDALNDVTDVTGTTTRAAALTALAGAANAAGFTASLGSDNTFTISGANLSTVAPTVSNITAAVGGAPSPTITNPPPTVLSASATTSTATSTVTTANAVHGVQQLDAQAAIANVTAAISKLGTISSQLGTASDHITGMQTFTSSLSSALTAGVGALTDADMATESAKLTSLQTKQQLGIQALSIANQQPQILLKLFGG